MSEYYILEYIWVDHMNQLQSKIKIIDNKEQYDHPPLWDSDTIILKPINSYINPFKDGLLVLCEAFNVNGQTYINNHRPVCMKTLEQVSSEEPLFNLEQDYLLMESNGYLPLWQMTYNDGHSFRGPFYISKEYVNLAENIAIEHMKKCLQAGLKITNIHAETRPSQWKYQIGPFPLQWKYQIGPLGPMDVCDQLWVARYILNGVCKENKCAVKFHPYKNECNWDGSNRLTNFSTKKMRMDGDSHEITADIEHLIIKNKMQNVGVTDSEMIKHIELSVDKDEHGYLKEHRPAANLSPYLLTDIIMKTILLPSTREG